MTDPTLAALPHEVSNGDHGVCVHSPENEWEPLCEELARLTAANVHVGIPDVRDAVLSCDFPCDRCHSGRVGTPAHEADQAAFDRWAAELGNEHWRGVRVGTPDAGLRERMRSVICALLDYAEHMDDCKAVETKDGRDCDCGWNEECVVAESLCAEDDALRAALAAPRAEKHVCYCAGGSTGCGCSCHAAPRADVDHAAERAALDAGTHEPAVDDFGNQYLAPRAEPEAGLREALATAICSTFDMAGHDHEAFLQPDHCEEGLRDADALLAAMPAAPPPLDVERMARAVHVGCGERSGPHRAEDGPDEWDRELAEAYAERYARLSEAPTHEAALDDVAAQIIDATIGTTPEPEAEG